MASRRAYMVEPTSLTDMSLSLPLSDHMLGMNLTHSIRVTWSSSKLNEQDLAYYFSDPRVGGGDIRNLKVEASSKTAVIEFMEEEAANRVASSSSHILIGQTVIAEKMRPKIFSKVEATLHPVSKDLLKDANLLEDILEKIRTELSLEITFSDKTYHMIGSLESVVEAEKLVDATVVSLLKESFGGAPTDPDVGASSLEYGAGSFDPDDDISNVIPGDRLSSIDRERLEFERHPRLPHHDRRNDHQQQKVNHRSSTNTQVYHSKQFLYQNQTPTVGSAAAYAVSGSAASDDSYRSTATRRSVEVENVPSDSTKPRNIQPTEDMIFDPNIWEYMEKVEARALREIGAYGDVDVVSMVIEPDLVQVSVVAKSEDSKVRESAENISSLYNIIYQKSVLESCHIPSHIGKDVVEEAKRELRGMYANIIIKEKPDGNSCEIIGKRDIAIRARQQLQGLLGMYHSSEGEDWGHSKGNHGGRHYHDNYECEGSRGQGSQSQGHGNGRKNEHSEEGREAGANIRAEYQLNKDGFNVKYTPVDNPPVAITEGMETSGHTYTESFSTTGPTFASYKQPQSDSDSCEFDENDTRVSADKVPGDTKNNERAHENGNKDEERGDIKVQSEPQETAQRTAETSATGKSHRTSLGDEPPPLEDATDEDEDERNDDSLSPPEIQEKHEHAEHVTEYTHTISKEHGAINQHSITVRPSEGTGSDQKVTYMSDDRNVPFSVTTEPSEEPAVKPSVHSACSDATNSNVDSHNFTRDPKISRDTEKVVSENTTVDPSNISTVVAGSMTEHTHELRESNEPYHSDVISGHKIEQVTSNDSGAKLDTDTRINMVETYQSAIDANPRQSHVFDPLKALENEEHYCSEKKDPANSMADPLDQRVQEREGESIKNELGTTQSDNSTPENADIYSADISISNVMSKRVMDNSQEPLASLTDEEDFDSEVPGDLIFTDNDTYIPFDEAPHRELTPSEVKHNQHHESKLDDVTLSDQANQLLTPEGASAFQEPKTQLNIVQSERYDDKNASEDEADLITLEQPKNGTVAVIMDKKADLAGYPNVGTLVLTFRIPETPADPEKRMHAEAQITTLLPYNRKGKDLMGLLQMAFRRRVLFCGQPVKDSLYQYKMIPNSVSIEQQKGFVPNDDYMVRLESELSKLGITKRALEEEQARLMAEYDA